MFIAHVQFAVTPKDRQKALDTLLAEAPTVRGQTGCHLFLPFADPADATGVGLIQEWATAEDFARYTGTAGFAEVGQVLRPMMTAAPVSRRFSAELLESVA